MRRAHRPEQTIFAIVDPSDAGRGLKTQFDVARKITAIVDIAGTAMGAGRQLIEATDDRLGDTTSRAQEIPAQNQKPGAGCLQAKFDRFVPVDLPLVRQRKRPDFHHVDLLAVHHPVGEAAGMAVAMGRFFDSGDDLRNPGGDLRLGLFRRVAKRANVLAVQMPARGSGHAGEFSPDHRKKHGPQHQLAEQRCRFDLGGINSRAAGAFGDHAERRAQRLKGSLGEIAAVLEPLVGDPVHRCFAPRQFERALTGAGLIENRPVGLGRFDDVLFWQPGGLVKPRGVGKNRPDRFGRPVELPNPFALVTCHLPVPLRHS